MIPPANDSPVRLLVHERDWAATALGPIDAWPRELCMMLEALLAAAHPMAIYCGRQLTMVYNDAFATILGNRHPAALGAPAATVWADIWEELSLSLKRVLEYGETVVFEEAEFLIESVHGTREARYFAGSMSPLRSHEAEPIGVFAVVREVTAQARMRQANEQLLARISADNERRAHAEIRLKASEARLRFLDDVGQATRGVTDATAVMAVTARLLGEHLGASRCAYADVEPDGNRFTIRSDWTAAGLQTSAGVYSLELFGPRAVVELNRSQTLVVSNVDEELGETGGSRMFRAIGIQAIICAPLVKNGRLVAMMAVHQDVPRRWPTSDVALVEEIVERCWAHIERVRDAARLQQEDERKNEFLAMLGHELRNPLAPLTNAHRLLDRSIMLTPEDRRLVEMAERQTRQLTRLVDDLLEVSRITRGKIELRPESMDASQAIRAAVDSVAPITQVRQQRVEIMVPDVPLRIQADPARVAQILENLLHNAAKYTPVGGSIRVEATGRANMVEIRVIDSGLGIDQGQIARLFQLFTQIDTTIDRSQGGLGIGLALVKRLAEMHGGDASAHSEGLGKGSCFTVCLPYRFCTLQLPHS